MSFKSKKKPPNDIVEKKLTHDLKNLILPEDSSTTRTQTSPSISIPAAIAAVNIKSKRTQSSSSSSSSKMIQPTTNSSGSQVKQQRSKTSSRHLTIHQRFRELFDTVRSRLTINNTSSSTSRRLSKQSIRSNDVKKRNSSVNISGNNVNNIEQSSENNNNNNNNKKSLEQDQENDSTTNLTNSDENLKQCRLCCNDFESSSFYKLSCCTHKFCINCLQTYLNYQITESRISISCPQCTEKMHPIDIYKLCETYNKKLIEKYEEFMLRRVLVTITDIRFCPAPDCNFAVIANGCASCPEIKCERPDCNTSFCYHCKQQWHPNKTCEDAAIINRNVGMMSNTSILNLNRSNSHISLISNLQFTSGTSNNFKDEMKRCPKCQAPIVKMDDGSCNHITCAVCGCEFCWLCMKEISDLHYLSPSGCTFWGKKPWSRKKKILWQIGTLIGAPIGIALLAGLAVPAILIGLPIWSGRKVYAKFKSSNKHKRNIIVLSTVIGTVIVSPIVAALTIGIGVPILLAYVYGVVPISLCRSGSNCGFTTNTNGVRFAFDDEDVNYTSNNHNLNSLATNQQTTTNTSQNTRTSILKTSSYKQKSLTKQSIDFDDTGVVSSSLNALNVNNNNSNVSTIPNLNTSASKLTALNSSKPQKRLSKQSSISYKTAANSNKNQQDCQSINVNNPSIVGCESIGAYTASLSASGSNIDRINDYVDDEAGDDYDDENIDCDRDSSSNRALAGSSRSRKSKISFDPKLSEHQQIEEKDIQQQNDVKSFDSYSK